MLLLALWLAQVKGTLPRSLLTPLSSLTSLANLGRWLSLQDELRALQQVLSHLLLLNRHRGLSDETDSWIPHLFLELFQPLDWLLLSDKHLSSPPVMLCGVVNIYRCHLLGFSWKVLACLGAGQVTKHSE